MRILIAPNAFTLTVPGPLGKSIKATLGFIDGGKTAVIEMADASGLKLPSKNVIYDAFMHNDQKLQKSCAIKKFAGLPPQTLPTQTQLLT